MLIPCSLQRFWKIWRIFSRTLFYRIFYRRLRRILTQFGIKYKIIYYKVVYALKIWQKSNKKAADSCVSGFLVSINIRIDYPKLSYIILLPLIFNELRLSGDGIARKRRFGPTPVDHFVDVNEMVYRLASHFLPDLVLSQMIIATTTARNAANVTIA